MPAAQHINPKSDIEISQGAQKRPIVEVAREKLGIAPENLEPYGHYKANVSLDYIRSLPDRPNGKLVLVMVSIRGTEDDAFNLREDLRHMKLGVPIQISQKPVSSKPQKSGR